MECLRAGHCYDFCDIKYACCLVLPFLSFQHFVAVIWIYLMVASSPNAPAVQPCILHMSKLSQGEWPRVTQGVGGRARVLTQRPQPPQHSMAYGYLSKRLGLKPAPQYRP